MLTGPAALANVRCTSSISIEAARVSLAGAAIRSTLRILGLGDKDHANSLQDNFRWPRWDPHGVHWCSGFRPKCGANVAEHWTAGADSRIWRQPDSGLWHPARGGVSGTARTGAQGARA